MRMPPSRATCRWIRRCPTCRRLSSQLAPSNPSHALAAVGGLMPTHCRSTSPDTEGDEALAGRQEGGGMATEAQSRAAPKTEHPEPDRPLKDVRQDRRAATQGRWAAVLIAPSLILLAIVIVYPVIDAVIMSFQKDAGLAKATGMFVAGGFAGFANYTHWILQQC